MALSSASTWRNRQKLKKPASCSQKTPASLVWQQKLVVVRNWRKPPQVTSAGYRGDGTRSVEIKIIVVFAGNFIAPMIETIQRMC